MSVDVGETFSFTIGKGGNSGSYSGAAAAGYAGEDGGSSTVSVGGILIAEAAGGKGGSQGKGLSGGAPATYTASGHFESGGAGGNASDCTISSADFIVSGKITSGAQGGHSGLGGPASSSNDNCNGNGFNGLKCMYVPPDRIRRLRMRVMMTASSRLMTCVASLPQSCPYVLHAPSRAKGRGWSRTFWHVRRTWRLRPESMQRVARTSIPTETVRVV